MTITDPARLTRICRHCKKVYPTGNNCSSRGLCRVCYHTPDIRERYHTSHYNSKDNQRRRKRLEKSKKEPSLPVDAPPASDEKFAEMQRRVKRGESLFHPLDHRSFRE